MDATSHRGYQALGIVAASVLMLFLLIRPFSQYDHRSSGQKMSDYLNRIAYPEKYHRPSGEKMADYLKHIASPEKAKP